MPKQIGQLNDFPVIHKGDLRGGNRETTTGGVPRFPRLAAAYDLPMDMMNRDLIGSGLSLEANGLYGTALAMMYLYRKPLPADDRLAAKMVHLDIRKYRHLLSQVLAAGVFVRLANGDVWAPIISKSRAVPETVARRRVLPSDTRADVLAKTNGLCAYCATPLTTEAGHPHSYHADHVLPVTKGGSDDIANLIPSCRSCNAAKNDKTALQFMEGRKP